MAIRPTPKADDDEGEYIGAIWALAALGRHRPPLGTHPSKTKYVHTAASEISSKYQQNAKEVAVSVK